MILETLLKIERITNLSSQEKLRSLERIVRQLREEQSLTNLVSDRKLDLSKMANYPQIQAEIAAIGSEFAITELHGLPNS